MAIPKNVHVDRLVLGNLRFPLLNEYYGSAIQKDDVGEIAREIQRRYLAAVPRRTGKLASTARITYHRTKVHPDRRWEAEFSIGGPAAPYVVEVEATQHILANVLREMGFFVGDRIDGPEGMIARPHREPPDKREVKQTDADRKKIHEFSSDAEQRREINRRQREASAAAHDPEAQARRLQREEDAIAEDRAEAIAALQSARTGSKAAEQKFNMADLHRYAESIQGRSFPELDAALAAHNQERIAAGMAPLSQRGIAAAEQEAQVAQPSAQTTSRRLRAGLYEVSGGERKFTVEQRRDIPGAPWRASDPDAFHDPHIGDFRTKGEAEEVLRDIIRHGDEQ